MRITKRMREKLEDAEVGLYSRPLSTFHPDWEQLQATNCSTGFEILTSRWVREGGIALLSWPCDKNMAQNEVLMIGQRMAGLCGNLPSSHPKAGWWWGAAQGWQAARHQEGCPRVAVWQWSRICFKPSSLRSDFSLVQPPPSCLAQVGTQQEPFSPLQRKKEMQLVSLCKRLEGLLLEKKLHRRGDHEADGGEHGWLAQGPFHTCSHSWSLLPSGIWNTWGSEGWLTACCHTARWPVGHVCCCTTASSCPRASYYKEGENGSLRVPLP